MIRFKYFSNFLFEYLDRDYFCKQCQALVKLKRKCNLFCNALSDQTDKILNQLDVETLQVMRLKSFSIKINKGKKS